MFSFCPLQGALSESTASQSLLELDGGVKVLIDVGWDETFDVEKLRELEKYVMSSCPVGCLVVHCRGSGLERRVFANSDCCYPHITGKCRRCR